MASTNAFQEALNTKGMSPANFIKAQLKYKVRSGLTPHMRARVNNANYWRANNLRKAKTIASRRRKASLAANRAGQIQAAHAAAAAAPMTAANIAFQERLARRAEELRALQISSRAAQNEIRRQRHINSEGAVAARALLNAENEEDFVNGEINSRNSLNPVITELQSQIYALERGNPVNSVELERARAMLEVAESQQMLERIEDELPRIVAIYGEDSAMVADMYDTQQEALERSVDAVARLEALQGSSGGRRRTRKHKRLHH